MDNNFETYELLQSLEISKKISRKNKIRKIVLFDKVF